jgi:hypothetical protein
MRSVITGPMVKGAASAAVTDALPPRYSGFCTGCGSVHVRELVFRLAALPAGIGAVPDTKPIVLAPLSNAVGPPDSQLGLDGLATAFYQQYGVGTPSDVAAHLGTSATGVRPALPADLVPVTVDGARSRVRAAELAAVRGVDLGAAADIVRLLPPSDPLLQPRDRSVLAPERAQQKKLWPMIGPPGAVLAGGGLAGSWRTRRSGNSLTITITPWRMITTAEHRELGLEAQLVGGLRGAARTGLVID